MARPAVRAMCHVEKTLGGDLPGAPLELCAVRGRRMAGLHGGCRFAARISLPPPAPREGLRRPLPDLRGGEIAPTPCGIRLCRGRRRAPLPSPLPMDGEVSRRGQLRWEPWRDPGPYPSPERRGPATPCRVRPGGLLPTRVEISPAAQSARTRRHLEIGTRPKVYAGERSRRSRRHPTGPKTLSVSAGSGAVHANRLPRHLRIVADAEAERQRGRDQARSRGGPVRLRRRHAAAVHAEQAELPASLPRLRVPLPRRPFPRAAGDGPEHVDERTRGAPRGLRSARNRAARRRAAVPRLLHARIRRARERTAAGRRGRLRRIRRACVRARPPGPVRELRPGGKDAAGAGLLVLTHLSPRYEDPTSILDDAKKVFENVRVAEDFLEVDVPYPE